MKIMFVAPYFYPKAGGLENYVYNIARELAKKDKIIVITSGKEYIEEEFENIKVYRLPTMFYLSHTPVNPFWLFKLKKLIKKENPDVINAHLPVPFIADLITFLSPEKTIITYHNDLIKNGWLNYVCKLYYSLIGNRTLGKAKKIIATSDHYVNESPYLKKFKDKISIISPGVDLEKYNTNVEKGYFNSEKKKILFVGQLDKSHAHKGLEYLLEAVKLLKEKNVHLFVIGNGDNIDNYKKKVSELELDNVTFLGFVSHEDLPKPFRDADVFVLPTYNSAEGFGMVLAEANACGTPVVGSNIGGIPVVIDEKYNGLLVPPRDSEKLAEAIQLILNDEKLAKRLGENGVKKAQEKWDWKNLAKKTREVFP